MNLDGTITLPVWQALSVGVSLVIIGLSVLLGQYASRRPARLPDYIFELRLVPLPWPGTLAESFSGGYFYERDAAISMGIMWKSADPTLTYYLHYVYILHSGEEYTPRNYGPRHYWDDKPKEKLDS